MVPHDDANRKPRCVTSNCVSRSRSGIPGNAGAHNDPEDVEQLPHAGDPGPSCQSGNF
jgi:hypothetical protein